MTSEQIARFDKDELRWTQEYMVMVGSLATSTDYRAWLGRTTVKDFTRALGIAQAWLSGYQLGFASGAAGLGQD